MDLVSRAKELAAERKAGNPTLVLIADVVTKLQSIDWDKIENTRMEQIAANLSTYLFTLSECINDAKLEHSNAVLMRRTGLHKAYFELSGTQKDREKKAEQECSDLFEGEAIAEYYYKMLQSMYHNLDKTISILQSIMSNRRAEMRVSKTQT